METPKKKKTGSRGVVPVVEGAVADMLGGGVKKQEVERQKGLKKKTSPNPGRGRCGAKKKWTLERGGDGTWGLQVENLTGIKGKKAVKRKKARGGGMQRIEMRRSRRWDRWGRPA